MLLNVSQNGFYSFSFKVHQNSFSAAGFVPVRNFTALHRLPSCEYENGVVRGREKIAIEEKWGRVAERSVS